MFNIKKKNDNIAVNRHSYSCLHSSKVIYQNHRNEVSSLKLLNDIGIQYMPIPKYILLSMQ